MKKRILFVVSSANFIGPFNRKTGNLLTEVAHPYEAFKKKGYEIDIYSVKGGEAPLEIFEADDPTNIAFLNGDGAQKMKTTKSIDEVSIDGYDAVFVPGGLAPVVDMPDNATVHNILSSMWEKGAVVSSVCHGPVSLLNVKLKDGSFLVKGKNITAFSKAEELNYAAKDVPFELEDALKDHGANYSSVAPWQPYSITDGKLVTGQNPDSASGVAERVIALLEGTAS